MSGPKISVYSLSKRARDIMIGQTRCEQQSILCVKEVKALASECVYYSGELGKTLGNLKLLQDRTGEESKHIEELDLMLNKLITEPKAILETFGDKLPSLSQNYEISEVAYELKKKELEKLKKLRARFKALKDEAVVATNLVQKSTKEYTDKIQRSISKDVSSIFSFEHEEDVIEITFDIQKNEVLKHLKEYLNNTELSNMLKSEVNQAINNINRIQSIEYLRTFSSITVESLFKKIEIHKVDMKQKQEDFKYRISRYQFLCNEAHVDIKNYVIGDEDEIDEEIDSLEKIIIKQKEQTFIRDSVDQVMLDMGYDLIGYREVEKKSGKQFRNEIYTFNEGTAVNVTISSDGQIAMEVAGIASEDRIPDKNETEVLTKEMEKFCDEFSEFERRLEEKGVILNKRIALTPPSAEYSTIININDYCIYGDLKFKEISVPTKKKSVVRKKEKRRDS